MKSRRPTDVGPTTEQEDVARTTSGPDAAPRSNAEEAESLPALDPTPTTWFRELVEAPSGELPFQGEMEAAFGEDFSGLEVTLGDASLAGLSAEGTADGEEVHFAEANPSKDVVAHELSHVVQFRRHGGGDGGMSLPSDAAEQEAEHAASEVVQGRPAPALQHSASPDQAPEPPSTEAVVEEAAAQTEEFAAPFPLAVPLASPSTAPPQEPPAPPTLDLSPALEVDDDLEVVAASEPSIDLSPGPLPPPSLRADPPPQAEGIDVVQIDEFVEKEDEPGGIQPRDVVLQGVQDTKRGDAVAETATAFGDAAVAEAQELTGVDCHESEILPEAHVVPLDAETPLSLPAVRPAEEVTTAEPIVEGMKDFEAELETLGADWEQEVDRQVHAVQAEQLEIRDDAIAEVDGLRDVWQAEIHTAQSEHDTAVHQAHDEAMQAIGHEVESGKKKMKDKASAGNRRSRAMKSRARSRARSVVSRAKAKTGRKGSSTMRRISRDGPMIDGEYSPRSYRSSSPRGASGSSDTEDKGMSGAEAAAILAEAQAEAERILAEIEAEIAALKEQVQGEVDFTLEEAMAKVQTYLDELDAVVEKANSVLSESLPFAAEKFAVTVESFKNATKANLTGIYLGATEDLDEAQQARADGAAQAYAHFRDAIGAADAEEGERGMLDMAVDIMSDVGEDEVPTTLQEWAVHYQDEMVEDLDHPMWVNNGFEPLTKAGYPDHDVRYGHCGVTAASAWVDAMQAWTLHDDEKEAWRKYGTYMASPEKVAGTNTPYGPNFGAGGDQFEFGGATFSSQYFSLNPRDFADNNFWAVNAEYNEEVNGLTDSYAHHMVDEGLYVSDMRIPGSTEEVLQLLTPGSVLNIEWNRKWNSSEFTYAYLMGDEEIEDWEREILNGSYNFDNLALGRRDSRQSDHVVSVNQVWQYGNIPILGLMEGNAEGYAGPAGEQIHNYSWYWDQDTKDFLPNPNATGVYTDAVVEFVYDPAKQAEYEEQLAQWGAAVERFPYEDMGPPPEAPSPDGMGIFRVFFTSQGYDDAACGLQDILDAAQVTYEERQAAYEEQVEAMEAFGHRLGEELPPPPPPPDDAFATLANPPADLEARELLEYVYEVANELGWDMQVSGAMLDGQLQPLTAVDEGKNLEVWDDPWSQVPAPVAEEEGHQGRDDPN